MSAKGYPKIQSSFLEAFSNKNNQFLADFFNAFSLIDASGYQKVASDYQETYSNEYGVVVPPVVNTLDATAFSVDPMFSNFGIFAETSGWGSNPDHQLTQDANNPFLWTASSVPMLSGNGFQIRANNQWDVRLASASSLTTADGIVYTVQGINQDVGNITGYVDGLYDFSIEFSQYYFSDTSVSPYQVVAVATITMTKVGDYVAPQPTSFSLIGSAVGSWDTDQYTFVQGTSDDTYNYYELQNVNLTVGEFKVRETGSWGWSVGEIGRSLEGANIVIDLSKNGGNIQSSASITYNMVLRQLIADPSIYALVLTEVI